MYETSLIFDHASFRYHYLCHYLPLAAGMDTLSRSLMKFKRGAQPDLDAWIDCARETLAQDPPTRDTTLVRALGHRETSLHNARPTPLDLLCQTLANNFGCRYIPALLSKTCETPGNKGLSRQERATQLLDVYSADLSLVTEPPSNPIFSTGIVLPVNNPPPTAPPPATSLPPSAAPLPSAPLPPQPNIPTPFLLIDDILTTGATIHAMIGALRRTSPTCPIRVFTLARAIHESLPHRFTPLQGRIYRLEPASGWVLANSF